MQHLLLNAYNDILESIRSRWFFVYSFVFGAIVVLLFVFGVTESRIMGFTGITRLLITYIQLTMAILPIFILITTVRSVAGDREAGVFEYLLSLPISLSAWFWGKMAGRFVVVFLPVFLALVATATWGVMKGAAVPWAIFLYYSALLFALSWCFLGMGMLISTIARSADVAQGAAFIIWLLLILFLDLILLGLLIREAVNPDLIVAMALANPLQLFRTAAMLLFDAELVLLGPTAYLILDNFGHTGYLLWAIAYPLGLGTLCAWVGYRLFRRGDLP
ncbi:MAG: ABC transporter permease subunit [Gammaproteobacteria bacterium]|nr:ABC transporter permease subunit [Gammaproteobacteria bacterium]